MWLTDGNGTWDLVQTRNANTVNEITDIDNTTGTAWATPAYDFAGNMIGIRIHQRAFVHGGMEPDDPGSVERVHRSRMECVRTGFCGSRPGHSVGSLRCLEPPGVDPQRQRPGGGKRHDARGYRIRKDSYVSGALDEERHYYYTPGWQVVEERVGSATTADRQYVWGLRYIDDLIERQRDSNGNGTLDETRYALQDANWNKQASTPTNEGGGSASAVESGSHEFPSGAARSANASPTYPATEFLNGSGTVQSSSASDFETLYASYRWDGNVTDLPPVCTSKPVPAAWSRDVEQERSTRLRRWAVALSICIKQKRNSRRSRRADVVSAESDRRCFDTSNDEQHTGSASLASASQ
ncbi:MAG: hypothetical protein R3C19_17085 [Planctomycetaceae bacterium]